MMVFDPDHQLPYRHCLPRSAISDTCGLRSIVRRLFLILLMSEEVSHIVFAGHKQDETLAWVFPKRSAAGPAVHSSVPAEMISKERGDG